MISLFLTALLGLFCCSSINTNALDQTKEIEKCEQPLPKNMIYGKDEYQNDILYMSSADFLGYDFFYYFTLSQYNRGGDFEKINLSYFGDYSISFGLSGRQKLYHNTVVSSNFSSIGTITFSKIYLGQSTDIKGDTIYQFEYSLNFKWLSPPYTTLLSVYYNVISYNTTFIAPIVSSYVSVANTLPSDTAVNFMFSENSGDGNVVFTTYYLPMYLNNHHDNFDITWAENTAYQNGYSSGYNTGKSDGYQSGYNQGLLDGAEYDDISLTIFTGILEVGLLPINVFLTFLDFDVFGINVAGFVSSLLTIAIIVIIIRVVTGKKDD